MVELIVGPKGRGKTKYLLDYAAREITEANGSIVFLDKNKKHMYELSNRIRLIDMSHFNIRTSEEFVGFILGILSQDHDLELVIMDAFLTTANLEGKDITPTINRLDEISASFNVKFVLSVGLSEDEVPDLLKDHITASL